MQEDYSEVTEKARAAIIRDGGEITPIEEGDETIYRVKFPSASMSLSDGKIELPSGTILKWSGNVDIHDGQRYPLHVFKSAAGRPKELQGDYETISVAIRKDLLAKIDSSDMSRREYLERLLERASS